MGFGVDADAIDCGHAAACMPEAIWPLWQLVGPPPPLILAAYRWGMEWAEVQAESGS